eukprot:JZ554058.1.p2 GENE.JZ554058.1~~JZ554058.1.p2  ORF type:complete len:197 (+),score=59.77 JZ554058.1:26-592(+)
MRAAGVFCLLAFFIVGSAVAYDRSAAVAYAKKWYNGANHDCSKGPGSCSPYPYLGNEKCGQSNQVGDCASFVSQCLLAGGMGKLGNTCGKIEATARILGNTLHDKYGWTRTCGYKQPPPSNIAAGDVLIFHADSCEGRHAHATFVSSVGTASNGNRTAFFAAHSSIKWNQDYSTYAKTMFYYEWLHAN